MLDWLSDTTARRTGKNKVRSHDNIHSCKNGIRSDVAQQADVQMYAHEHALQDGCNKNTTYSCKSNIGTKNLSSFQIISQPSAAHKYLFRLFSPFIIVGVMCI